jgi:hypothetical protein
MMMRIVIIIMMMIIEPKCLGKISGKREGERKGF